MNHIATSILAASVLALFGTAAQAAAPKTGPKFSYDQVVDAAVARYHLSGIAVGVIKDGKVVYTGTRGKLQSGQRINGNTLFKIGSNTKAMTVTTMARLAQQGKLRWDAPVTQYLPNFRMYVPWVTKNMKVGDLVAHHSGLNFGAGDLMLWPTPNHFTAADVVHGMRYLKPTYSFRHGYSYTNTTFVVAGQVAAAAGGAPYGQLVRREVFQPLGMTRCQIGTWNRKKVGNVALPHVHRHGHSVVLEPDSPVIHPHAMDAAGGVRCSLNDMLTWAMNWVAPTPKQLQWLSPKQRRKEWQIYTPVPISRRQIAWNHTRFYGNGHGWFLHDADKQLVVSHTGVLSGMYSAVTLLPDLKSGFVILINTNAGNAITVLKEVLLKHLTAPGTGRTVDAYANEVAQDEKAKHAAQTSPDTSSRQPATAQELASELGVWRDPWFGKVRICPRGNAVHFTSLKSPTLTGQVMRVGKRYMVQWDHADANAWLKFPAKTGGKLHMATVNPDADFSYDYEDLAFTRVHSCK